MANESEITDSEISEKVIEADFDTLDDDARKDTFNQFTDQNKRLMDVNRQLFARAKKAEGFEFKDGKWIKPEPKPESKPKEPELKPLELGYDHKAFLITKGIEEFDIVSEEMKKFTGTLEELIMNPYFKQRLETVRTEKANADATDIKSNRRGTNMGQNSPEYWLNKLKPDEQIPAELPRELREKIVAARRAQNKDSKMFYNE